jgi:hypothetical protein
VFGGEQSLALRQTCQQRNMGSPWARKHWYPGVHELNIVQGLPGCAVPWQSQIVEPELT